MKGRPVEGRLSRIALAAAGTAGAVAVGLALAAGAISAQHAVAEPAAESQALQIEEALSAADSIARQSADPSRTIDISVSLCPGSVVVSEAVPEDAAADDESVARKAAAAASELVGAVVTRAARDSTGRCGNVLATRVASVTWQERFPDGSVASSFSYEADPALEARDLDVPSLFEAASAYRLADGTTRGAVLDHVGYLTSDGKAFSTFELVQRYQEERALQGMLVSFRTCEVYEDNGAAPLIVFSNGCMVEPGTGIVIAPDGTRIIPDEYYAEAGEAPEAPPAPGATGAAPQDGPVEGAGPGNEGAGLDEQQPGFSPNPEPEIWQPETTEEEPPITPSAALDPDPGSTPAEEPAPLPNPDPVWVYDYTEYVFPDSSVFTDFVAAQAYQEEQALAGNLMGFQSIDHCLTCV